MAGKTRYRFRMPHPRTPLRTPDAPSRRFLVALGAGLLVLCAHADDRLRLNTGEYEPFTGATLQDGGPLTEIVRMAFAESGVSVDVDFLPWKRGYAAAQHGEYDAIFPYGRNADRERDFLFTESFYNVNRQMYYRASSGINPDDPASFKGKTYCSPLGFTLYKELADFIERKELVVETAPNLVSCARMLAAARVDFFVATPYTADAAIRNAQLTERLQSKPFGRSENYLLVPKGHRKAQAIITAFNKGLASLRAKGEVNRIASRRGL